MRRLTKVLVAGLTGVVALTMLTATGAPAQAHGDPWFSNLKISTHVSKKGLCASFTAPVAPAEGQPRSWDVAMTYCQPFRWAHGAHEVDVLTHGSTYDQKYWDWPQDPKTYSYVGKTLDSGRATLNYDRIGNGNSTRPPALASADITMASDAFVLHQLMVGLTWLGYRHINSISHSYGVGVALAEATATYLDKSGKPDNIKADKLVFTGYLHRPSNPAVTAGNYPANTDPKFKDIVGLDSDWLTTRVGVRGAAFHAPTSDPALVALDEDTKGLVSKSGLLGFLGARNVPVATNISNKVMVPVLVVGGQRDAIFCYDPAIFNCADVAAVTANELPYYAAATSFTLVTIPDSGHDLTLHPTGADASYRVINAWIKNN